MFRYVIKRLALTVLVVLVAAWLIFTIMYFVPGDPAKIMLGGNATYEEIQAKREQLGLTGSYLSRLGTYMYNCFLRGDFGTSWTYQTPVFEQLVQRLPYTLIVTVSQMLFSLIIGVPLGVYAALHQNQLGDKMVTAFSMLCISIPGFWLSLEMVILFSLTLGWLPAYGVGGPQYYILPVIGMSLGTLCQDARQTRSAVLDVVREDYVTTAKAKGISSSNVTLRHILPNALLPIITMIGGSLGGLIAGSAITEQTFSIPGVGLYMLTAMNNRDYPVVEAITILLAAITSICMLLTDLAYAAIDPRIKAEYTSGSNKRIKRRRRVQNA